MNKILYKQLAEMIEKETGIVYTESDFDRLTYRVEKMKELLNLSTDEELIKMYQNSPSSNLQSLLISTSTNNETSFFRDKKPFEVLVNTIIPAVIEKKVYKNLKIWSVATSTGQEPYSIAMKLKECPLLSDFIIELKGSDIDQEVLAKAKAGIYNQAEVQRGLPIQYLIKYFDQIDPTTWTVKNELKSFISFFNFNLISGMYPNEEYDIIFCRNVLIYQSIENKNKVINNLYKSLKPGGFLVLGGAENLIGIKSDFKMVPVEDLMIYRKD